MNCDAPNQKCSNPLRGIIKLNYDAAFNHEDSLATIAMVARDHAGCLVDGASLRYLLIWLRLQQLE